MVDSLLLLKRRVVASSSLTQTLKLWCEEFGIGEGSLRSIHASHSGIKPPSADALHYLRLDCGETTRHRSITLARGDAALLDADNWYIPERLPAETNRLLETTDTPFGAALPKGGETRRTVFLDVPPPVDGVEDAAGSADAPILIVRAVVMLNGVPVSFVEERLRPLVITAVPQNV